MPLNTRKPHSFSLSLSSKILPLGLSILLLPNLSLSLTCPTKLEKTPNNMWYSQSYPKFKKQVQDPKLIIDAAKFGAAVYNMTTTKMSCTYGTNNPKEPWIALVSLPSNRIKPDLNALNPKTLKPVWQYSNKHHDVACTQSLFNCPFNFEEVTQK